MFLQGGIKTSDLHENKNQLDLRGAEMLHKLQWPPTLLSYTHALIRKSWLSCQELCRMKRLGGWSAFAERVDGPEVDGHVSETVWTGSPLSLPGRSDLPVSAWTGSAWSENSLRILNKNRSFTFQSALYLAQTNSTNTHNKYSRGIFSVSCSANKQLTFLFQSKFQGTLILFAVKGYF